MPPYGFALHILCPDSLPDHLHAIIFVPSSSCHQGSVTDSRRAEDAAVAFDFRWRAQCLCVVVGELHGGPAFDIGDLADQSDGIESTTTIRIATAEIVGQQRTPTCAESNTAAGNPLSSILEVQCAAEIAGRRAIRKRPTKVRVQPEYLVDVECVGGDEQLVTRIAASYSQPFDIFVTSEIGILAVDSLAGPIGGPVRGIRQELRCAKGVRQHDPERAFVGVLP